MSRGKYEQRAKSFAFGWRQRVVPKLHASFNAHENSFLSRCLLCEIKHNLAGNKAYLGRARGTRWW
jgi:hypothetical protein